MDASRCIMGVTGIMDAEGDVKGGVEGRHGLHEHDGGLMGVMHVKVASRGK